jgi:hypothetical protein
MIVPAVNKKPKNRNASFMAELTHSRALVFRCSPPARALALTAIRSNLAVA